MSRSFLAFHDHRFHSGGNGQQRVSRLAHCTGIGGVRSNRDIEIDRGAINRF
jgi:hypothetical protein